MYRVAYFLIKNKDQLIIQLAKRDSSLWIDVLFICQGREPSLKAHLKTWSNVTQQQHT